MRKIILLVVVTFIHFKVVYCSNISVSTNNSLKNSNGRPQTLSFLIRPCPGFEKWDDLSFLKIPVLHPGFEYYEQTFILHRTNPLKNCPFGGELSIKVSPSAALEVIPRNVTKRTSLLRTVTVVLDNGYLSVGENRVNLIYYSPMEYCVDSISEGSATFKTCSITESRPVFKKCCPLGMVLGERGCVLAPENFYWTPNFLDATTFKPVTVPQANGVFTANRFGCDDMGEVIKDGCSFDINPTTTNQVVTLGRERKWVHENENISFCFETKIDGKSKTEIALTCGYEQSSKKVEKGRPYRYVYMVGMYIGAFFHLLTTLVYLITWKRQNVHRRALCSCTLSLCCSNALFATIYVLDVLRTPKTTSCVSVGVAAQYFMVASFTWLCIINLDLYCTFTNLRKADPSKNLSKLISYNIFGWGFPLAVSLISLAFEFGFSCATTLVPIPGFGVENCFLSGYSQGYYLYYILAVLISASFLLAIGTLVSIRRATKQGAKLQSSNKKSDKQTVLMYLRLSVLMGVTWTFEVISWIFMESDVPHIIWLVFDVYNFLSAILIFIFFVCNKQTLDLLKKMHPVFSTVLNSLSFT